MSTTSPYVRRLRLGNELRELRRKANLTAEQLGSRIGASRLKISRLETAGSKPDLADVWKILDVLNVEEGSPRWRELIQVARDAAERGWWEAPKWSRLGVRQARGADLESGAVAIKMYETELVPGLLQTEEYYRALCDIAEAGGQQFDRTVEVQARIRRQEEFTRDGGPVFDVVVEEQAIRRLFVPADVMRSQLEKLLQLIQSERITFRVLPVNAVMVGVSVPRAAFEIYSYADPGDPTVVHLDNVTADVLMTEPDDVEPYVRQFEGFGSCARSQEDSARVLTSVVDLLATEETRGK